MTADGGIGRGSGVPETGGGASGTGRRPLRSRIGLWLGLAAATGMLLASPPSGLEPAGWRTAAVGTLMAIWWLTEAIPLAATALLPLALLPLLGAGPFVRAAAPYANPVIFLFLGGFLLALGMQRWGLHRRIALAILARSGSSPRGLLAGFMAATAFLSLWVSNTATAMMMLPIALSVAGLLESESGPGREELTAPLLLGVAYAASIGGMGTLIGTPPNAFLAGFVSETYGIELGFARWMLVGLPLVAVALPLAWLLLARVVFRLGSRPLAAGRNRIRAERSALGPAGTAERRVAVVCVLTAAAWIARPLLERRLPGLTDAGIAVAAGVALFLIPSGEEGDGALLDWAWASRLPWDLLLLFGGGLSLAGAIGGTGLDEWIGGLAGAGSWPVLPTLVAVAAAVVLLTELTSNTATAAAFLPIVGAVAVRAGWDPLLLAVPAALAASCAFMLPVATPPNAIVYGSHRVTVPQMARSGLWLNLAMIPLVAAAALLLVPLAFGGLSSSWGAG